MKVIFLFDDNTAFVTTCEELQLRQIDSGVAGFGVPAGKNEEGLDLFRSFITYPVQISVAPPSDPVAVPEPEEV